MSHVVVFDGCEEVPDNAVRELISVCRATMQFVKAHYGDGGRIVGGEPRKLYDRCKAAVEAATKPRRSLIESNPEADARTARIAAILAAQSQPKE